MIIPQYTVYKHAWILIFLMLEIKRYKKGFGAINFSPTHIINNIYFAYKNDAFIL